MQPDILHTGSQFALTAEELKHRQALRLTGEQLDTRNDSIPANARLTGHLPLLQTHLATVYLVL